MQQASMRGRPHLKEDNFAHMAHTSRQVPMVPAVTRSCHQSWRPTTRPLASLYDALEAVDGKNKYDYTVEMLTDYKKRHEERIHLQTDVGQIWLPPRALRGPIRERRMSISSAQAYDAISPRFPVDPKGVSMDYSALEPSAPIILVRRCAGYKYESKERIRER